MKKETKLELKHERHTVNRNSDCHSLLKKRLIGESDAQETKGNKYCVQFSRWIGCVDALSISCDNPVHHDQMFRKFFILVIFQEKLPRYRKDLHQIKKQARSAFCHPLLLVTSRRATEVVFLRVFFYWFSLCKNCPLMGLSDLAVILIVDSESR